MNSSTMNEEIFQRHPQLNKYKNLDKEELFQYLVAAEVSLELYKEKNKRLRALVDIPKQERLFVLGRVRNLDRRV